jgi:thiamine transport system substrate-binding protein
MLLVHRYLLLIVLVLFTLVGCSRTKPEQIVVYTYASFPSVLVEDIKEHFSSQYKIEVDFKTFGDTGPLFNRLLQERDNPQADVVIGLDNNYFFRVKQERIFKQYRPKAAARIKPELIFDEDFFLTPYDFGYIVFNFDSEKVTKRPKTYQDLLKPIYKEQIIVENPLTSSPGQAFVLATVALFGEDGYLDYWRGLKDNRVFVAPGWDEAYGMFTNGERPIVLSYGTSPVYHLLYENTERYKALVLDDAAYAQIEGVGIVAGSRKEKYGEMLVEYILSREFQEKLPVNQYMYPAVADANLPESFRVAAQVSYLLNLHPEKVANNLQKWLNDWERVMNE